MSVEAKTAAVVNGIAPQAGGGTGFHHHLPQISTMSRNPKIAQSKASAKNAAAASSTVKEESQTVNIVQLNEENKEAKRAPTTPAPFADKPPEKKETIRLPPKKSRHSYEQAAQEAAAAATVTPNREKRQIKKKVPKDELFENEKPQKVAKVETPVPLKPQVSEDSLSSSAPTKYLVGDLLWAKVSGHPFWPCMVSYDPFINIFTRVSVRQGRQKASMICRSYHVQFFGNEGERGWINESSVIPFEGKENFFKRAEDLIENASKSAKSRVMQMYKVNASRRPAWEVGVASAEEAYALDRNDRKQQFTFTYAIPAAKTEKKKDGQSTPQKRGRKRKQCDDEADKGDSGGERIESTPKKRRVSAAEDKGGGGAVVHHKVTKYAGSFESFCHKHREGVLDDHPEYDEEQVVEYLDQQWRMMTNEQRARYITKNSGSESEEKAVTGSTKRSPRVSRPTVKKLEAEEGSKLFSEIVAKKRMQIPRSEKKVRSSGRPVRETRRVIQMEMEDEVDEDEMESPPPVKDTKPAVKENQESFESPRSRRKSKTEVNKGESTPKAESTKGERTPKAESTKGERTPKAESTKGERTPKTNSTKGERTPKTESTKGERTPKAESTKGERTPKAESTKGERIPKADSIKGERTPKADSIKGERTPKADSTKPTPKAESAKGERTPKAESAKGERTPKAESAKGERTPKAESAKGERSPKAETTKREHSTKTESVKKERTAKADTNKVEQIPKMDMVKEEPKDCSVKAVTSVRCEVQTAADVAPDTEMPMDQDETAVDVVTKKRARAKLQVSEEQASDSGSEVQIDGKPRHLKLPKDADPNLDMEIFKLNISDGSRREPVCNMCEDVGDLVECVGPCQSHFHVTCLGLSVAPTGDFKCDECRSGQHVCFSCKRSEGEVRRCTVSQCGRFYHEECVVKYPQTHMDGKRFTCPLHACATCVAENYKNPKASKGRLYRCVRCPTAYHVGDFCIAAGGKNLPGLNIVCSNHFQPKKSQAHHSHVNVSWCFICSQGGTLLCCESCPAAFHAQCLKIDFPQGSWYCHTCRSGKKPLYGDIIWVKLGNYRWWPGEICHPRNVPTNIQEKVHDVGEFPVKFLGSRDYFWLYQGRVFLFQEGDKGSRDSTTKGIAKIFAKGVKEATEAFKIWKQTKENREQLEHDKNDKKPAPFKFIKTNIPIGNVIIRKAELGDIPRCECSPAMNSPCTQETNCLNTILMYECHPQTCPAGDKCQNQRFQKRQYPESTSFKTGATGWGLKTLVDIKKGQFVNEYVGDLVDEEECKRRMTKAHEDNISNFYMLTLDKNRIIDACPKGNLSRFMNHSCSPNCETQKWTVNGDIRVGLFALQDVKAGSELTFNYNLDCLGNDKKSCICGSENCSGFLGVRPKSAAAVASEKKSKEQKKRRKKRKLEVKKEHEDDCFRCGEGGELVMCDKSNCPKSYHLQCLNLAKPPHGKWLCPWHHCDNCGKLAKKLCSVCPNSYCNSHIEGKVFNVDGVLICCDHAKMLEGKTLGAIDTLSETSASESYAESVKDDKDLANVQDLEDEEMEKSVKTETDASENGRSSADSISRETDGAQPPLNPAQSGMTIERKPPVGNVGRNAPQQRKKTVVNSARKANIRANLPTESDNGHKEDAKKSKVNSGSGKGKARSKKHSGNTALPDTNLKGGLPVAPMFDDSDEEDQFSNLVIDFDI